VAAIAVPRFVEEGNGGKEGIFAPSRQNSNSHGKKVEFVKSHTNTMHLDCLVGKCDEIVLKNLLEF
jgi:hypothetical protein